MSAGTPRPRNLRRAIFLARPRVRACRQNVNSCRFVSAPAESEEQLVEIQDLVHERQAALQAERQQARSPEPVQEECGPQPGCFPQHAQEDTPRSATPRPAGRWRTVPIPGCHPPRVRRIWEPFEEGESRDEQAAQ